MKNETTTIKFTNSMKIQKIVLLYIIKKTKKQKYDNIKNVDKKSNPS